MTPGIFKYRLNRQIIYIFFIIIFLLIVSVLFTNRTINRFGEEIKHIDEINLEQLKVINKILHNAGVRRQAVLIYLFSNSIKKEQQAIDIMQELQEENKNHFSLLSSVIQKEYLKNDLAELIVHREAYSNSINNVIAMKKAGKPINVFDDEEIRLEPYYNIYIDYLENLSDKLAANASDEIEEAMTNLSQLRKIYTAIIIMGCLIIFAMVIGMLLIAIKLTNDFTALERETAERKEAEKKLRLANQELEAKSYELNKLNQHKDKFISVISHDLRNPISSIIGSSGLLLENMKEIEEKNMRRMVEIIDKSSRNILQQLNGLIELAQSTDTKKIFNPVILNLHEEVNVDVKFLWDIVQKKHIQIKNQINDNVFIQADKLMFRSMLQNLLTNALKYTGKGGEIVISALTTGNDMVEITITDSGIGIKKEDIDNLFSESVASKPGTEKEIGTGMGLNLVKDFVEKHAGTIRVESIEGKGTTVSFTLPRAKHNG